MQLTTLDWTVVAVALAAAFLPALLLTRRAGRGTAEFFASGRSAPWWLIGTSMVATTFSTDTPNLVTDFVRTGGVSKNWLWWAFLLSGMATVFFYARLWRRSGALTDLEFYELRYSGRPAAFVRGFRAVYLGFIFNACIMAAVTLAAVKIGNLLLGWPPTTTIVVCGVICVAFSSLSGLMGVMAADVIQFAIAMVGVFAAAWVALDQPQVGGLAGMVAKLDARTLSLLPDFGDWSNVLAVLILPLAVQWWAVWYPGAEPGGGGYVAQRMLAARSEGHALTATLWFNVAHYALRPWPWIIVALCSMLVFPKLSDIKDAYPHVDDALLKHDIAYPAMISLLPAGLLGLLVASLLSAYVSTMSTHLNWGASYLVHDLYRRFIRPGGDERHYVWIGRVLTVLLMVVTGLLVPWLDSAKDAFSVLLSIGAGTGLIYLLRWYWWRINAWSEIAAMIVSFAVSVTIFVVNRGMTPESTDAGLASWLKERQALKIDVEARTAALRDDVTLIFTVVVTTIAWLAVTYLTPPADRQTLVRFCRLVKPAGPGWGAIRTEAGIASSPDSLPQALLAMLLGCAAVYAALFGTGSFLYGQIGPGWIYAAIFALSGGALSVLLSRMWRSSAMGGMA